MYFAQLRSAAPVLRTSNSRPTRFCIFVLFFILSLRTTLIAQQRSFTCGTDERMQQLTAVDSAYRAFIRSTRQPSVTNKADDNEILTIPVVFLVYHLGEPVGTGSNLSDEVLQAQLGYMNDFYSRGVSIGNPNAGPDTRIRFVMARRGPDCAPINGVVRVDGRAAPGYESQGVSTGDQENGPKLTALRNLTGEAGLQAMRQGAVLINVYWRTGGASAWAPHGYYISISKDVLRFTNPTNWVLSHEMGHFLSLYHTFEGGQTGCPVNTNPLTDGDQVADTEPQSALDANAAACMPLSATAINPCTGKPYGAVVQNIMNYACEGLFFTAGQIVRMRNSLRTNLSSLVNSPYCYAQTLAEIVQQASCMPATGATLSDLDAGQGQNQEGIAEIKIGTLISRTAYSRQNQPLLYDDFSCLRQVSLQAGQSYTISINAPYNNTYRRVYIDWNNDGSFSEATERAFSTLTGEDRGTISVPANAVLNQSLRMRIVVCDGTVPPTACFVPVAGAVQDYGVMVRASGTTGQLQAGLLNSLTYCAGQTILVPYVLTGLSPLSAVTVSAELSDASGNFTAPLQVATGTTGLIALSLPGSLVSGTNYRIRLSAAGLTSVQTQALTIRQPPTARLTGPAELLEGKPLALSLTLTSDTPALVSVQVLPRGADGTFGNLNGGGYRFLDGYGNIDLTNTLTIPAGTTTLAGLPNASPVTYRLFTVDNGCRASSVTDASVTLSCGPPDSLTETDQTTNAVILKWARAGLPTVLNNEYTVQWKEATAATWSEPATVYLNEFFLSGLSLGRVYQWRVASTCSDGSRTAYSPVRSFTMNCPAPFNVSETTTPTFASLNYFSGSATAYTLQWRLLNSTAWQSTTLIFNSFEIPNPVSNQVYEWRVSSTCANGSQSAFTAPRTFTVSCGTPFIRFGNASAISTTSAVVSGWSVTPDIQYRIRWRAYGTTDWTLTPPVTGFSASLTGLPAGNRIEWQIQAICSGGTTSGFSGTSTFDLNCLPPSRPAVSGLTSYSALISWQAPASSYQLEWRKAGTVNWQHSYYLNAPSATTLSYELTGLDNNTTYEVRAVQNCLGNVTVSEAISFTTPNCPLPGVISLAGPVSALSGQPFSLTATFTGSTPIAFTTSSGQQYAGITSSPFVFTVVDRYLQGPVAPTYFWIKKLINACGNVNFEQVPAHAIIVSVPSECGAAPTNPKGNFLGSSRQIVTTIYSVQWDYMTNATRYLLQWRTAGAATWTDILTDASQYYFRDLPYGKTYEWRVSSVCDYGYPVTPTASQTFSTGCRIPQYLTESYSSAQARLSWADIYAGDNVTFRYAVRWRQAGSNTWTTSSTVVTNGLSISGLSDNTVYEWQVQSLCPDGGASAFSPVRSFTTGCGIPAPPAVTDVAATSVRLSWQAFAGVNYTIRQRVRADDPSGLPSTWTVLPGLFTGPTASVTGLMPNTLYLIQIQAVCADGQRTPFSESTFIGTSPCEPLNVIAQPVAGSAVCPGTLVTASVTVRGSDPLTYQWFRNGVSLGSAQTSATLTLTNVSTATAGTYIVTVTDPCGNSLTSTAFSLSVNTGGPARLYVNQQATGLNTGLSWADAFTDLQSALTYGCKSNLTEIWVAAGLYKPTGTADRSISFSMLPDVAVYGGFAGTELTLSQRPAIHITRPSGTTLSGDIGSPASNADNSFNVIRNTIRLTDKAVLDGFVITGGNTTGASFSDFTFEGGGMLNLNAGTPRIQNCLFVANQGAAMSNRGNFGAEASPTVVNCAFISNTGGAVANSGNYGGAGSPVFINCLFRQNTGRAISSFASPGLPGSSSPRLINCTFLENPTGAISSGASGNALARTQLINCILWNNTGGIATSGGSVSATYSLFEASVSGYVNGPGNLTATVSPFVSATSAELSPGSPAIDAGDPGSTTLTAGLTDLAGNPRFINGRIDMGAFEFLNPPGGPFVTVKNGSWTDPAVWSLNQVPAAGDDVTILHTVFIPAGSTATVRRLSYGQGGTVQYGGASTLRTGF